MAEQGVFCSTAGTFLSSKQELEDHYRSDFHRYNLKRKVAGLPPVTREWYEARKAQLLATSSQPVQRVWFDPLTKKKFSSENTYLAYTRSKKYLELVKKSGEPAPAAIVTLRRADSQDGPSTSGREQLQQQQPQPSAAPAGKGRPGGFVAKPVAGSRAAQLAAGEEGGTESEGDGSGSEEEVVEAAAADEGSDWETASEEDMEAEEDWEEWDLHRSLFDNYVSPSFEANLEYMFKRFGFYFPDADCLADPEGLLRYLGAKLQYGHVPLYERGDREQGKQFSSLHGVQRHMVDTGRCKMLYDGNEEEYEEYYDYSAMDDDGESTSGVLILSDALGAGGAAAGYELVLPAADGSGSKILGSREFARYYRQRHRPGADGGRPGVAAARVLAEYRRLAVPLLSDRPAEEVAQKREARRRQRWQRDQLRLAMRANINNNLPKNVPF